MSNSQRIGLYYPYLHFPDNWLKVAALYWPRMGRITPVTVHLSDSDTVRTLSDELNFTVNVEPGPAARKLTSALVRGVEDHYDEFRAKYSIPENPVIMSDSCGPDWPSPQRITPDWRIRDPRELRAAARVVALHRIKLDRHLFGILSAAGLAFKSGDWVCLHPELAWLYMCALTDELARQNMLIPTTDQLVAHVESLSWTNELFINTLLEHNPTVTATPQSGRRERVALLALDLVIPKDLNDVPVQKIVKIRQKYAADFDAFYDEVTSLATYIGGELSEITNAEVLAAYIDHEARRRFHQPLETLRKEMQGQGVEATVTALTTKFEIPTSATLLAGGLLTHHPVVGLGGVVAMGIVSTVRDIKQSRYQVSPSAASYLWRLEQELRPRDLMESLLGRMY